MSEIKIEDIYSVIINLDEYVRSEQEYLQDRLETYRTKYLDYYKKNQKLATELVRAGNLASYNAGEAEKWKHLYEKLKGEWQDA